MNAFVLENSVNNIFNDPLGMLFFVVVTPPNLRREKALSHLVSDLRERDVWDGSVNSTPS